MTGQDHLDTQDTLRQGTPSDAEPSQQSFSSADADFAAGATLKPQAKEEACRRRPIGRRLQARFWYKKLEILVASPRKQPHHLASHDGLRWRIARDRMVRCLLPAVHGTGGRSSRKNKS